MSQTEPAKSLYALGWRQGTLFDVELPLDSVVLDVAGGYRRQQSQHAAWVVVTQDCDLAAAASDADTPHIEVRPVATFDPPPPWGVRSRLLRLSGHDCLVADSERTLLSPRTLHVLAGTRRREALPSGRLVALKTWLGLRYDRPAVPDDLVDLARAIARRAADRPSRPAVDVVHDLLAQFDTTAEGARFILFAIVSDDGDKEVVRAWLGDIGAAVPADLGIMAGYDVGTRGETSLALIESTYALDVSDVTWRGEVPRGAQ